MTEREKIIEAMARYAGAPAASDDLDAFAALFRKDALERAEEHLAAIAEQGYAVVPRALTEKLCHAVECRDEPDHVDGEPMCVEYWQDRWGFLLDAADIVRSSSVDEPR